jgi:hypothetical protein
VQNNKFTILQKNKSEWKCIFMKILKYLLLNITLLAMLRATVATAVSDFPNWTGSKLYPYHERVTLELQIIDGNTAQQGGALLRDEVWVFTWWNYGDPHGTGHEGWQLPTDCSSTLTLLSDTGVTYNILYVPKYSGYTYSYLTYDPSIRKLKSYTNITQNRNISLKTNSERAVLKTLITDLHCSIIDEDYLEEQMNTELTNPSADVGCLITTWKVKENAEIPEWVDVELKLATTHQLPEPMIERAHVFTIDSHQPPLPVPNKATKAVQTTMEPEGEDVVTVDGKHPVTGKQETAIHGWVIPNQFNFNDVIATVIPFSTDGCEIDFVGRGFETAHSKTRMVTQVRSGWSLRNCCTMRRPLSGVRLGPTMRETYSALLRTAGAQEPITEYVLTMRKLYSLQADT